MSQNKTAMAGEHTTIAELKSLIEEFVADRDWAQFHSPKNLAMAIGVEAGELMDLFRWHSEAQSVQAMKNVTARKKAAEELADVVICALAFSNRTGINLAQAVRSKVLKNSNKYPSHMYKGRFQREWNTHHSRTKITTLFYVVAEVIEKLVRPAGIEPATLSLEG